MPQLPSVSTDSPQVVAASEIYDFGPDNMSFQQPVEITIGYDDSQVPGGVDEAEIGPLLFNGTNWVAVDRHVVAL